MTFGGDRDLSFLLRRLSFFMWLFDLESLLDRDDDDVQEPLLYPLLLRRFPRPCPFVDERPLCRPRELLLDEVDDLLE